MTSAAHHTMMGPGAAPTVFRYVGLKFFNRGLRTFSGLNEFKTSTSDTSTTAQSNIQVMKVRFSTSSGTEFDIWSRNPSITNYVISTAGRKMKTGPQAYALNTWVPTGGGGLGVPFYTSPTGAASGQYNKLCMAAPYVSRTGTHAALYDYSVQNMSSSAPVWDSSSTTDVIQSYTPETTSRLTALGLAKERLIPFTCVFDFGSVVFDTATYTTWKFWNAGDNASQPGRTWVEGEVIGSVDNKTWYRLDIFNDTSIPNTNNAIAYTGNIVVRKKPCDFWYGIDLTERDWTNGITVDTI